MFEWLLGKICPDSLAAKDIALSTFLEDRQKPGFKSRSGQFEKREKKEVLQKTLFFISCLFIFRF